MNIFVELKTEYGGVSGLDIMLEFDVSAHSMPISQEEMEESFNEWLEEVKNDEYSDVHVEEGNLVAVMVSDVDGVIEERMINVSLDDVRKDLFNLVKTGDWNRNVRTGVYWVRKKIYRCGDAD